MIAHITPDEAQSILTDTRDWDRAPVWGYVKDGEHFL